MEFPEYVLIVANSGRMLAESSAEAGLKPLVVDLYADSDTRGFAAAVYPVPSLAQHHIAPVLDALTSKYSVDQLIYGSGFEAYPESLNYLNERFTLVGNSPEIFTGLQHKPEFFSALNDLKIPYPKVSFETPEDAGIWLVKPVQGQGGIGIQHYCSDLKPDGKHYWQKFQPGTPYSVLFLADGKNAQVVGFNRQWTVDLGKKRGEFVFSGVMNACDVPQEQKSLIAEWMAKCVRFFGLKGLNSLDFIHFEDRNYVLEINPRPSASMQLYANLLVRHIAACRGVLFDYSASRDYSNAFQIIYASRDFFIPDRFEWPVWTRDRPSAGFLCRAGEPICSIIAHQNGSQVVSEQLAIRQQHLINKMIKVQPHGI